MSEKTINSRIIHKHDIEANWLKATNFIPKQGEIIVYDIDTTYTYERIKIGDGKTVVSALPFVYDALRTALLAEIGAVDDKVDALDTLVGDTAVATQISNAVANKADSDHTHDGRYYTETEINTKLSAKADANHTHEISELTDLSGASVSHASTADSANEATHATTADTANAVAWANVTGKPSTYTPATHSHAISDVTNLQTTLNAKVPTSRTVNGKALSANITLSASDVGADASGSANTALTNAKAYTDAEITEWIGDTKVSEQISDAIADKVDKVSGKGLSTNDYTTTEKNKLSGIAAGAEVNQNAFSNVVVGSTTIAADAKTDTLTIVAGSNVTITPDATNDKITIAATDTVYTHPTYTSKSSGLYKVTVDGTGHVSAATAVAKSDITALGIPAQDTTYSAATTSAAGLMSASDKSKLDGIDSGANKITVDSALSSTSTNPVQNKVVNSAISNLNTLVGDKAVSTQISDAIAGLVDSSPDTLNTLNELAAALGDDPNFATTVATQIGTKVDKVDGKGLSTNDYTTAEKNKLAATNVAYGTCSTAAATAAKVITVTGNTNWTLAAGSLIVIYFDNTNSASNPTFNVNGTGAKNVWKDAAQLTTSSLSYAGYAKRIATYMYDGTQYRFVSWGYDGNTNTQIRLYKDETGTYPIIGSHTAASSVTSGSTAVYGTIDSTSITMTPSSGTITATTFSGNATSATKATQDASGNVITSTYATKTELDAVSDLVGDTAVSEQIEAAQMVYVGPTQPTDPNIKVWINTAEEGTGVVPVLPRIATITLAASSWTGNSAPYSQVVEINTVTSATKIDLQPTVSQIVELQNADIALMAENIDGVVTIYSFGGKPSSDMTMQVLLTEVSYV